jgi:uncharacterized protein (TIGR02646 family)
MRPIRRNTSPRNHDFDKYQEAKPDLVARLGPYCSFCERHLQVNLAVEHIQPKGLAKYQHLIGRWDNFLLACVNCNSTKKNKDVYLERYLLPDRDNTFFAYIYTQDGKVSVVSELAEAVRVIASSTLSLVGLDKLPQNATDSNGRLVALDRISQRREAWATAEEARSDIASRPNDLLLRKSAVRLARECGFFSIWMTVFLEDADMRSRLIDAFPGTRDSECYDYLLQLPVSPAPNPDILPYGGKI